MKKLHRLLRYDWPLHFVLLVTNWLPDNVIFIRLRGAMVRPFFKQCGRGFGVGRNVVFYNSSKMEFGDDVYVAYGCWFNGRITIEDEVLFGPYCILAANNHTRFDGSFRFGGSEDGTIVVKRGSWLGAHALVVANSSLGQGSVLAANSLLNCESEDDSLYAGSPAKRIRSLSEAAN